MPGLPYTVIMCRVRALTFIILMAMLLGLSLPAMASTFTAYGTVTDANDYPVYGASVTLVDSSMAPIAGELTDINGNFVFNTTIDTDLFKVLVSYTSGNTTYAVTALNVSWYSSSGTVQIDPGQTRLSAYPPAGMPANTFTVYGSVTDADGKPVAGANVTLVGLFYDPIASALTGPDGNFSFNVTSESYVFKVLVDYSVGGQQYGLPSSWTPWYQSTGVMHIEPNITRLYDYPPVSTGFIYGYLVKDDVKQVSGTVYLSNGDTVGVPAGQQYLMSVSAGHYEIYAVHTEDGKRYVSDKVPIDVTGTRYLADVNPTVLKVKPVAEMNWAALLAALLLGAISMACLYYLLRKMLN